VVSRIVRGVQIFNTGDNIMPLKKPLPMLVPQRLRKMPRSFAWIDHRIRSEGILKRMQPADIGLYLFLALAADRNGLSCWRLDRIEREVPCFDRHGLWAARDRLVELGMIAYRPWRSGDPDGCYQVLSVERPEDRLSPELNDAISKMFRKIETQHTGA
jgi:hypothetical protein